MKGKVIIFSAPSGSGKSTIIGKLKENNAFPFSFSVSATNRPPRGSEIHGKDYYFMSDDEFHDLISNNELLEYCEVYPGRFYGTLKSEVERRCEEGENVVLDVDVEGGINIKKIFGKGALSIFIMPPSIEELKNRLENRGTDSPDKILQRLARAEYEISLAPLYDVVVKNEELTTAVEQCEEQIKKFI